MILKEVTYPSPLCRYIELKAAIKEVYNTHYEFWSAQTGDKDFPPETSARTFKNLLYDRTNKVDMLHTEIERVLPLLARTRSYSPSEQEGHPTERRTAA